MKDERMYEWRNEWMNGWMGSVWCFKWGFFRYCYLMCLPLLTLYVSYLLSALFFPLSTYYCQIGDMIHLLILLIVFLTRTRTSGWRKVSPLLGSTLRAFRSDTAWDSEFQRETHSTNEIEEEASRGQSDAYHERVSGVGVTCPRLSGVSRRLPKGRGIWVNISRTDKKAGETPQAEVPKRKQMPSAKRG